MRTERLKHFIMLLFKESSGRTIQRFLKSVAHSPIKKDASHEVDGTPRYCPDEVGNHSRPLPSTPMAESDDEDEEDDDDPADYDEVCA